MNYRQYSLKQLLEGGNLSLKSGKDTEETVSSERIDLSVIDRDDLVPILKELLETISNKFEKKTGVALWEKAALDELATLSGSSKHFFDLSGIKTQVFKKTLTSIGDIDTMVDITKKQELIEFLTGLAETSSSFKLSGAKVSFVGFKNTANQLLSIWKLTTKTIKLNVQIDFELVDFEGTKPTQFSTFSHSSNWSDLGTGIKGAFHKILLRAVSRVKTTPVLIQMKNKEPKEDVLKHYSFAVSHGLRAEFEPVTDEAGTLKTATDSTGGSRLLVKKLDSKTAPYDKDLSSIFKKLFGNDPSNSELNKMESFKGLLDLINTYYKDDTIKIVEEFVELIWDTKLRMLAVDDSKTDFARKSTAVKLMLKTLKLSDEPSLKTLISKLVTAYYPGEDYAKEF